MADLEPSNDSTVTSETSGTLPTSQQPEDSVPALEEAQEIAASGSSNVPVDVVPSIMVPSVDLKSPDMDTSVLTSTEATAGEKVNVEATNHGESRLGEIAATGQQYFVVLTSDQNGKVLGAVPQGAAMVSAGMLSSSTLLRPQTPVTIKRGAAKTNSVTKPAAPSPTTLTGTVVIPRVQAAPRPPVGLSPIPQAGQALRMISLAGPTASSPTAQIFAPAGTSASAIAAVTNAIKKPMQTVVKPVVPTGVVITRAPIRAVAATPTVVSPIRKLVPLKTPIAAVAQKPAVTTKVLIPPSQAAKSGKPIASVDKLIQQKRLMAESILKMRKIERVMVQARPDQATPFSYGEIFHQASVSFSKMAALTTHISLESQTPVEQRRWSPDLINKFVNSINAFATSMKEVGDDLKKRHEHQLVANLKRKADTEVVNAKKLASLALPAPPNVMTNFLASVSTTNGPVGVVVPPKSPLVASGAETTTTADASPAVVKHPLEITTENTTSMLALSNLLSNARTNGLDVEKKDDEASQSSLGSAAMDTSSQESSVNQSEATAAAPAEVTPSSDSSALDASMPVEGKDLIAVKNEIDEPSTPHSGLTNGFTGDILTEHKQHPALPMEETATT